MNIYECIRRIDWDKRKDNMIDSTYMYTFYVRHAAL